MSLKALFERLVAFAVHCFVRHPIQGVAKRFQHSCLPSAAPADHAVETVIEVHLDSLQEPACDLKRANLVVLWRSLGRRGHGGFLSTLNRAQASRRLSFRLNVW